MLILATFKNGQNYYGKLYRTHCSKYERAVLEIVDGFTLQQAKTIKSFKQIKKHS